MKHLLHFKLNLLRDHLAFLKAQNEITSQLLTIIKEAAIIRNKKTSLFNKIINFKEFFMQKITQK